MKLRFLAKVDISRVVGLLYEVVVLIILIMSLVLLSGYYATNGFAAEKNLNTSLPKKHYSISAGSLGKALSVYAAEAGVVLAFDPYMTDGKTTQGINGEFGLIEGFNAILKNSGLEIINNDKGDYTLKKAPIITAKPAALPLDIELKETQVRAKRFYEIGPMPGLGLTKEEIPGNVQSITSKEIKAAHSLSITDLLNSKLQSVNVNDYQSNPFQMDVTYRGFTASPQLGTSQGLSVFLDGIRVNEPFGDVVNWDMIPMNALSSLDVFPGSNPLFGLGTLGGAISMKTKSGFTDTGGTAEILTGSFGRKQLQGSWGGNNGVVAGFVAANIFDEDGWRKNSPSKVNQLFGKAEWRNDKLQLGLSTLFAGNDLIGNGLLPSEAIKQDPSNVFTSPDETKNRLLQFQLSSVWDVTDNFNITSQIYHRNSKRHSSTGDINQDFGGYATRKPNPGEQVTPGYADTNGDGLPDFIDYAGNVAADANGQALDTAGKPLLVDDGNGNMIANPDPQATHIALIGTNFNTQAHPNQAMVLAADGVTLIPSWVGNNRFDPTSVGVANTDLKTLVPEYYAFAKDRFAHGYDQKDSQYGDNHPSGNGSAYFYDATRPGEVTGQYTDQNGFFHVLLIADPINMNEAYVIDQFGNLAPKIRTASVDNRLGKPFVLPQYDANGNLIQRDGADPNYLGVPGVGSGYVQGTPTALITTTDINQVSDGGAIQFNWNLDKNKLMVGASVDMADATYTSAQQLGLLDANHRAYLDPENIGAEFSAATTPIGLNDFAGNSITSSLYASETWTPINTLNITAAARYSSTQVHNKLAVNNVAGLQGPNAYLGFYDLNVLCPSADPASCPSGNIHPFTPVDGLKLGALGEGQSEKFNYHSLNPSLGATWQANEQLNVYGNWSQGARTPSVIELGCAYDDTPVVLGMQGGVAITKPRSLYERRFCSLPSTLSGDPYLKQVVSQTTEFGVRGRWGADIEWNASVYRSNLQDDIYFVSFTPDRSFFQNIGETRRQGLELGLKGHSGKASFSLNYALTDATFQSTFEMASPNNSSAGTGYLTGQVVQQVAYTNAHYQQITVNPGNRMPGIPLHNLNANFTYQITDRWQAGLTMVMHSGAYVRGNENNKHQQGPADPIRSACTVAQADPNNPGNFTSVQTTCLLDRPDFNYSGKTVGYATFNFQTSYKLDKGLTLGLLVNNLFDKEYASAGRLGINPFSPSINGAIGPSGFNYNSREWQSNTFLAPGAPRSAWVSLTYDF